jgi:addiction module RelE/StbE family toxin
MGYQVIWTDEAIADLRQLVTYVSRDNTVAAVKLGEELIRKSLLLSAHPRLGRRLREPKRDTLREIMIPPYRLIYEIDDDARTIRIRVLWHGARRDPEIP